MTEVYDYDYWFNQTASHGNVFGYGPEYVHNQIIKEIVFQLDLPAGKIVMLGSNRCYGLEMLCKHYGYDKVIGYDLYNPTNHKCVITTNFLHYKESVKCAFIVNDIGNFELTPQAKIYAQKWAAKNTVKDGFVLGNTSNNKAGYEIEQYMSSKGFDIINLTSFSTQDIPKWALENYVLYKKVNHSC